MCTSTVPFLDDSPLATVPSDLSPSGVRADLPVSFDASFFADATAKLWDVRLSLRGLAPMTQANVEFCQQLSTDPFSFRVQYGTFQNLYYFRDYFSDSVRLIPFVSSFDSHRPASLFWHRDNPAPQPSGFRGLVHDGAGLASPSIFGWDSPTSLNFLPDPLHRVREVMLSCCTPQLKAVVASLEDLHLRDSSVEVEKLRESIFGNLRTALVQVEELLIPELAKLPAFSGDQRLFSKPWVAENHDPSRSQSGAVPQCFRLHLIERFRTLIPDGDDNIIPHLLYGVTLSSPEDSYLFSVRRKPQVADQVGPFLSHAPPYRSWFEHHELAQQKFDELIDDEVLHGPMTWPELCVAIGLPSSTPIPSTGNRHIDGVAGVRFSAILNNGKIRLVADSTVNQVNHRATLYEAYELPGLSDVEACFRADCLFIGFKMDIRGAFHTLKIPFEERRLCVVQLPARHGVVPPPSVWYFYSSMPQGTRTSGYWWQRFIAVSHRISKWLLRIFPHASFIYVDDSLFLLRKTSDFVSQICLILIMYQVFGFPISFSKTMLGCVLPWVGYELDLYHRRIHLTQNSLKKIQDLFSNMVAVPATKSSDLESLVGKMGWGSEVFPLARVYLHPFYKLLSKNRLNDRLYFYQFKRFSAHFSSWLRLILQANEFTALSALSHPISSVSSRPFIRVDACAQGCDAFLGGWFGTLDQRQAFSVYFFMFRIDARAFLGDVDDDFDENQLQRYISCFEALAIAVAIALFSPLLESGNAYCVFPSESDSIVACFGTRRWYSPSPVLQRALQLLAEVSVFARMRPLVTHVSGKKNVLADAISRYCLESSDSQIVRLCRALNPEKRLVNFPFPIADLFSMLSSPPI